MLRADFVISLYNPISSARPWQLGAALGLAAEHRPPETPVIFARAVSRPDEAFRILTLAQARETKADMATMVIIGASATRLIPRGDATPFVYTPAQRAGVRAGRRPHGDPPPFAGEVPAEQAGEGATSPEMDFPSSDPLRGPPSPAEGGRRCAPKVAQASRRSRSHANAPSASGTLSTSGLSGGRTITTWHVERAAAAAILP